MQSNATQTLLLSMSILWQMGRYMEYGQEQGLWEGTELRWSSHCITHKLRPLMSVT